MAGDTLQASFMAWAVLRPPCVCAAQGSAGKSVLEEYLEGFVWVR